MSSDAWEVMGPALSAPFGATCEAAFAAPLLASKPALSQGIDDYARDNGVGDDLLDPIAAAATGDLILVVTVAGRVRPRAASGKPDTASLAGGTPATTRSGAGPMSGFAPGLGYGPGHAPPRGGAGRGDAFEMSASLFSVPLRRSVALLTMKYAGESVDEAVRGLAAKLGATIPGSKCGGWNINALAKDPRVRALAEP